MIVNGVIVSKDENKFQFGQGLKLIEKGFGLEGVKGSGLSNVKRYGSGLKILHGKK